MRFKPKFKYTILYVDDKGAMQHIPVKMPNAPNVGDRITFRDLNDEIHYRQVKCLNWYVNVYRGLTSISIELKGF